MSEISDQVLTGSVPLDGNTFTRVSFKDADLIFDGGVPPNFNDCRFDNARFSFRGAARQTVLFLNGMAPSNTNMREVVYGLIPGLRE